MKESRGYSATATWSGSIFRATALAAALLILATFLFACQPVIAPASDEVNSEPWAPTALPAALPAEDAATSAPTQPMTAPLDLADLSLFAPAMIPAAVGDVAAVISATHPTRYLIDVTFDPETRSVVGQETVEYTNNGKDDLAYVYFRLFPNFPGYGQSGVAMLTVNGEVVTPRPELKGSALRVPLRPALRPQQTVTFQVDFAVDVPTELSGNYGSFAYVDDVLALAGFYPLIPVHDDKGWQMEIAPNYGDIIFSATSLYLVRFTLPTGWTVVASGSTLSVADNVDGTTTWTLASGPMRDFNIIASPLYVTSERRVGDVVVRSTYKAKDEAGGKRALEYAASALAYFNQAFGPYPFAELDVAATPNTAAGIEYPGLIVIADRLYGEVGGFFEWATVHETAHQWWYSLVGNDQVDEPWLDEALTQYSTFMYLEKAMGEVGAEAARQVAFENPYRQLKAAGRDQAVGQPVRAFSQDDYGSVVYSKGPLFFHALRQKMGDEKWLTFLQTYLQAHRYRIATPQSLLATAAEVCQCDVQPLYRQWITGTQR